MACFTVPLAAAAAAGAARHSKTCRKSRNPFVSRLDWLAKMLLGGSFLLAIEHVWHGEVQFTFPFLTAVEEGPEAVSEMLREMATRGVAMAVATVAAWACMVAAACTGARKAAAHV